MTELGNRLKEARLAKGLSLDDLQSMTKIQKRYLTGIEEGNYSSMPGNFYVRAFIKQYAEALELNPEEIFETYKGEIPSSHHEELPDRLSRVKTRKISDGSSKIFDILPKVLIGVFLIGAASIIYIFFVKHTGSGSTNESINSKADPVKIVQSDEMKKAKTPVKKKKPDTEKKDSETTEENTPPPVDETPKQTLTVGSTSGSDTTYSLTNAEKFEVKLVSRGKTWVNIKNGKLGKSFFQGTLTTTGTAEQTVDLSAEKEAYIRIGNAADTDIFINDQKLEYANDPAKVTVQNITIQYVPMNP